MAHWFPKLRDLDVPTPETKPLPLKRREDKPPTWDTRDAIELVESFGGEAFVRSGYTSADYPHENGSRINNSTEKEVEMTLLELASQHSMMEMPFGEKFWMREWLDLNYCEYARENLVPEIRAFVRDGSVVCYHPRLEGFDSVCDKHRSVAEDYIEHGWNNGAESEDSVSEYAQRVADEFSDGWWSVDFVLERGSWEWYCTDMALDAVYERDGEIRGVSGHPEDCEHDVENYL